MKKTSYIMLVFVIMLVGNIASAASAPMKITILPVRDQTYWKTDDRGKAAIDKALRDALHIPLYESLNAAVYTNCKTGEELSLKYLGTVKSKDYRQNLGAMGKDTGADIIILPVVRNYEERITYRGFGETGLYSEVTIDLYLYDRENGIVEKKTAWRHHNGEYWQSETAIRQTRDCMDELIRELKIRERVYPKAINR